MLNVYFFHRGLYSGICFSPIKYEMLFWNSAKWRHPIEQHECEMDLTHSLSHISEIHYCQH